MNNGKSSNNSSRHRGYIGVVGGRDFNDKIKFYEAMVWHIAEHDYGWEDVVIVSGGATGVDTMAEQFAHKFCSEKPVIYRPDPSIIEARGFAVAAKERNQLIVNRSDYIIAFWDGKSRGTRDTINRAAKAKKPVIIIWI